MMIARSTAAVVSARIAGRPAPAGIAPMRPRSLVVRRFRDDDANQADTSTPGKAPKNPLTGERLTPVTDVTKEGYQATQQIPQKVEAGTSARILSQLPAQPEGRPFGEIQAFDGLGPEIINGRLAMLGFAIAAFFELAQGKDVFQQVKAYPLLTVATFTLFTIASWIPFMQGQSYNVKSGPFTPRLEVTTGRIAMLGFTGLILNEVYFKHPVFPHLF